MENEVLYKYGYIDKVKDKDIYLSPFLYAFSRFSASLREGLKVLEAEEISSSDMGKDIYLAYLNKNFVKENVSFAFNDDKIKFFAKKNSYQLARKTALDIILILKGVLKNICSIYSSEGHLKNDDELCLTYVYNQHLHHILRISVTKESGFYYVEGTLPKGEFKNIFSSFYDEEGIIMNSSLIKAGVALLPYKENKEGVREYVDELEKKLTSYGYNCISAYSEKTTLLRRKELRKKGVLLFLEAGPKEKDARQVRCSALSEEFNLINEEDILAEITKKMNKLNKKLYQKSVSSYLEFSLENGKEVCEKCFSETTENDVFVPFSQNLTKCECNVCKMKSSRVIILE